MINDEQKSIGNLVDLFFSIFDNRAGNTPNFDTLKGLFIKGASIVKKNGNQLEKMSVSEFIVPRIKILTDGTLVDFYEWQIKQETYIALDIATHICTYGKNGLLNGEAYSGEGEKHIQLLKTPQGWKIASILWQDHE